MVVSKAQTLLGLCLLVSGVESTCPDGPFKLHDFKLTRLTGIDRPYFIVVCDLAQNTRLDPLMQPGKCNSHMHSVFGSNRFGPSVTLDDMTLGHNELANTTCSIPADGSMYWAPSLYFHNRTENKYHIVPSYLKAYYFNRGDTHPLQRMPVGLRMIRGDPYRKQQLVHENSITNDTVNIFWYGSKDTGGFPDFLDEDWQVRIMFPNCWDGLHLETALPGRNTHMAFRGGVGQGGTCPDTHPLRIPQLFTEVNYQIEQFTSGHPEVLRSDFLLATGDKNGWGAHVDYISGWQQDTLDAALETCVNTDQNNPNCTFHQFLGDIPAAEKGGPGTTSYFKPTPVEKVTDISQLLVTGEEMHMSGFPAATCTFGAARDEPAPLMNIRGALNTTHCGTLPPTPAAPTTPPTPAPPTPPTPPTPVSHCAQHVNMDVQAAVLAQEGPGRTPTDCCAGCTAHAGCHVAVHFAGWCYYKPVGKQVPSQGRTACTPGGNAPSPSTPTPSPSPAPAPTTPCNFELNTDLDGNDMQPAVARAAVNPTACCALCGNTTGCKFWSWQDSKNCYLKTSDKGRRRSANTSGRRPASHS
jgi:hypothetical protein